MDMENFSDEVIEKLKETSSGKSVTKEVLDKFFDRLYRLDKSDREEVIREGLKGAEARENLERNIL